MVVLSSDNAGVARVRVTAVGGLLTDKTDENVAAAPFQEEIVSTDEIRTLAGLHVGVIPTSDKVVLTFEGEDVFGNIGRGMELTLLIE